MTDTIVLEAEVQHAALEKWLIDYGKDQKEGLSDAIAGDAVAAGYIFDTESRNFTDKGLDLLEASGVPIKTFQVLTLGRAISPIDREGKSWNLRPGSEVLVLFSGKHKKNRADWDDVLVSDAFPILRLYRHSADVRSEHRWPATWPLAGQAKIIPLLKERPLT